LKLFSDEFLTIKLSFSESFWERQKEARKDSIKDGFEFDCNCTACEGNYPLIANLTRCDPFFESPDFNFCGTFKESKDELKKITEYLERLLRNGHHPTLESCQMLIRNNDLLIHIGHLTSCPFIQ
jgi:hypothetical protein